VPVMGIPGARIPDTELVISELIRVLLPCSEAVPEAERGWDITRGGVPVPITEDEMMKLDIGLPVSLLMAILADVNNPNRRKPSLSSSRVRADSVPTVSPTTTASSPMPNGQASLPGPLPASTPLVIGSAGESGFGP
jgi:hypothetical protein